MKAPLILSTPLVIDLNAHLILSTPLVTNLSAVPIK